MKSKKTAENLLGKAGIKINGDRPFDIKVHNERFYKRVLSEGSLGLGESYMDDWWDADALDEFFNRIFLADLTKKARITPVVLWNYMRARVLNAQKLNAFKIGQHHYDMGNDLCKAMLDKRLTYTCAYWKDAKNLDEAQVAKLDLVCRKLGLKKGQRVLDIGSGWGSFIRYAAERYGVSAIGITVSKEQSDYANENRGDLPIETRLSDYRDINEKFDHVVSLGMFEHVGHKNYRAFMRKVRELLKDDGLFLLHTIGKSKSSSYTDPWIAKYIFPEGMLPSIKRISAPSERLFVMEDWHNFGADYDKTLISWFNNFESAWPELKDKYGERFYRMWKYYLLASAGSFRSRQNQLWQIVYSKKGVPGGYKRIC